jgi:hypothetical protein
VTSEEFGRGVAFLDLEHFHVELLQNAGGEVASQVFHGPLVGAAVGLAGAEGVELSRDGVANADFADRVDGLPSWVLGYVGDAEEGHLMGAGVSTSLGRTPARELVGGLLLDADPACVMCWRWGARLWVGIDLAFVCPGICKAATTLLGLLWLGGCWVFHFGTSLLLLNQSIVTKYCQCCGQQSDLCTVLHRVTSLVGRTCDLKVLWENKSTKRYDCYLRNACFHQPSSTRVEFDASHTAS